MAVIIHQSGNLSLELFSLQRDLYLTLQRNGPMTRSEIVQIVKKPRTTVYDNLSSLIETQVAMKYNHPTNTRGRPLVFFKLIEEK